MPACQTLSVVRADPDPTAALPTVDDGCPGHHGPVISPTAMLERPRRGATVAITPRSVEPKLPRPSAFSSTPAVTLTPKPSTTERRCAPLSTVMRSSMWCRFAAARGRRPGSRSAPRPRPPRPETSSSQRGSHAESRCWAGPGSTRATPPQCGHTRAAESRTPWQVRHAQSAIHRYHDVQSRRNAAMSI